jgi:plasmid stabilization system protein ParE
MMADDILFKVSTPIDFSVRVTRDYWKLIVTAKHPIMQGRESDVESTLRNPDEIRRSRSDPNVYLFYHLEHPGRWICAVTKHIDDEAFLITTYPTDAIKEGERIWSK